MPIRTRRLALRRENLSSLTTPEMEAVAGGDSLTRWPSCDTCPSLDQCPTLPIRDCKIHVNGTITTVLEGTV